MDVLIRGLHPGLNLYEERSRLSALQLARWQGLPLVWVDASPRAEARSVVKERPVLALLDAGEAQAEIQSPRRTVRLDVAAGAMGLFLPGVKRSSRWRCHQARRVMLDLDVAALAKRGLDVGAFQAMPLREDLEFRDGELEALLRAMACEVASGCPNGRLYAESASLALLAALQVRLGLAGTVRERGRLTRAQLTEVENFVEQHLEGELSLAALASVVCLSAPHFARLFRNATGFTPHRYVMRKRTQRACELLQRTAMPLAAVAQSTGFSSQSHMNAVIGTLVGATPGEVRRIASRPSKSER
jgi:AraC family transcriptional regulator